MTVDDLIGVYIEASNAVVWEAEKRDLCPMSLDIQRAGVTAIVRAVRDEIFDARGNASYGSLAIYDLFNEILGSDAGEKVAGGSTREDEPGGVEQAVPALTPATDAAPAVCVWTPLTFCWQTSCGRHPHNTPPAGYHNCACGKPIAFTEVNHG